jgi:hypothetical protein
MILARPFIFRLIAVLMVVMFCAIVTPAQADPRGWFGRLVNGLFGDIQTEASPEYTGIAPFAGPANNDDIRPAPLMVSTEGTIPLNRAHLEDADLVAWAMEQIVMGLTLHPHDLTYGEKDPRARKNRLAAAYTSSGQADLEQFFGQWGGTGQLIAKGFELSAFTTHVPGKADVKNKGLFGDTYRWLVDVPVTMTILPAGQKTYRGPLGTRNVTTKTYVVRVQVGRAAVTPTAPFGAMIERFTVLQTLG